MNDDGLFEHCACCAHSRRSGCGGEDCPCAPVTNDPDECSDTCRRMQCEWCPEYDRQAQIVASFVSELDQL